MASNISKYEYKKQKTINDFKNDLIVMIKENNSKISYKSCDSNRDYWKCFKKVYFNEKFTEFVICIKCNKILKKIFKYRHKSFEKT